MQGKTKGVALSLCVVALMLSVSSTQAIGRIDEARKAFRVSPQPVLPMYVEGVTLDDLLAHPTPDQLYSYAKDNEAWTREFLADYRAASEQTEQIDRWLGDPVLVALIDFETGDVYTATFSIQTGEVEAVYADTKTELWAALGFVQEALVVAHEQPTNETIPYLLEHYYTDWAVWVQVGFMDVLVARETIEAFIVFGAVVFGLYGYKKWK